ncbi:MAG: hypothetical protein U1F61_17110 [Opitutaceae bacterium]
MREAILAFFVFAAAAQLSGAETPGTTLRKSVDALRACVLPPLEEELSAKETHNRREIDRRFAFGGRRIINAEPLVALREALRRLDHAVQSLQRHESIYMVTSKKERYRAEAAEYLEKQRQEYEPFAQCLRDALAQIEKTAVKFDRDSLPALESNLVVALGNYARSIGIIAQTSGEANP